MKLNEQWIRTEWLLGTEAMQRLVRSKVLVFGLGGVGSYAAEALARSGVGTIGLVDYDVVSESNLNRQLIATYASIGQKKVAVMHKRISEIAKDVQVNDYMLCYTEQTCAEIPLQEYDYIVDAIDMVCAKLTLICEAKRQNIPIISCMGAGNKLDPTQFRVADLYETSICPLAKVMRKELRARGITELKVVYSKEVPRKKKIEYEETQQVRHQKQVPGSVAFVPSVAGFILAGEVIKDLSGVH